MSRSGCHFIENFLQALLRNKLFPGSGGGGGGRLPSFHTSMLPSFLLSFRFPVAFQISCEKFSQASEHYGTLVLII